MTDKNKLFKDIQNIQNPERIVKDKKNVYKFIREEQNSRMVVTLENWMYAINTAENKLQPRRMRLLEIYKATLLDSIVSSRINNRINLTVLNDFNLIDQTNTKSDEIKKIFEGTWFREIVKETLLADYWGYSLIQFGDIVNSKITEIESVDRFYVSPERQEVLDSKHAFEGESFDNFDVLFIGKKKDLGILHKVAYFSLMKKQAVAHMSTYLARFGSPIAHMNISSATRQQDAKEMLDLAAEEFRFISVGDDELKLISPDGGTNNDIFLSYIEYCDQNISLLISGHKDDGNSTNYADAGADETKGNNLIKGDSIRVEDFVNTALIPFMIERLGYTELIGCRFEFNYNEQIEIMDQFTIDSKLMEFFDLDMEDLELKYGTKILAKKETAVASPFAKFKNEDKRTYEDLYNLYYPKKNKEMK